MFCFIALSDLKILFTEFFEEWKGADLRLTSQYCSSVKTGGHTKLPELVLIGFAFIIVFFLLLLYMHFLYNVVSDVYCDLVLFFALFYCIYISFNGLISGELAPVGGTAYDLRSPITFGEVLPKAPGKGFDHNFCLHQVRRGELGFAARFHHPPTGTVNDHLNMCLVSVLSFQ